MRVQGIINLSLGNSDMAGKGSKRQGKQGASKKQRRAEHKSRNASRRHMKWIVIALGALVVAALWGWYSTEESGLPGQAMENMGRAHVPDGSPSPIYNSAPPTSGPHAAPARWGEHNREIAHINQVHNLEHGGVLIQYNCGKLVGEKSCPELQGELRAVLTTARREIDPKIVLAPYNRMERPIAVTAWTRLQYFDTVDAEAILHFARATINNAPEQVQ